MDVMHTWPTIYKVLIFKEDLLVCYSFRYDCYNSFRRLLERQPFVLWCAPSCLCSSMEIVNFRVQKTHIFNIQM